MAALKHHGTEVSRVAFRETIAGTEYNVHLSFRSDGHVMRRLVALNIHQSAPHDHDYGWKLWKRLQNPQKDTAARQQALAAYFIENYPTI